VFTVSLEKQKLRREGSEVRTEPEGRPGILNSNYEARIAKQIRMSQEENPKRFDLEDRTYAFAKRNRALIKRLTKTIANIEDARQLVRSSGSVGANYIEANESLSKKDFILRIKICRKESKESRYWLRLVEATDETLATERNLLVQEAQELMNIFGAIVRKSE
jgi:four helix bundle protein